jgi:histidine triad (HIT) family protein
VATVFERIAAGEIEAEILHHDGEVTAFRDANPQAPVHILIVPNRPIPSLDALDENDQALAGKLLATAARLARREGLAADGYRVIVNAGEHGGQEIPHLHLHLLGGRPLGPMLAR